MSRLGTGHPDLRVSEGALGRLAWERGDAPRAVSHLRAALARADRSPDQNHVLATRLALAEVLLASGRAAEALPLLQQAARQPAPGRRGQPMSHQAMQGQIQRLLGEAARALGDTAAARVHLHAAVRLTRAGYGPAHAQSRLAQYALARYDAQSGDPAGLARLDALARAPGAGGPMDAVHALALGAAAQVRCRGPESDSALRSLDTVMAALRSQQPDGGALTREVAAIHAGCTGRVFPVARLLR